jgi:hypothetical protein
MMRKACDAPTNVWAVLAEVKTMTTKMGELLPQAPFTDGYSEVISLSLPLSRSLSLSLTHSLSIFI